MASTTWRAHLPWRPAGVTWRGQRSGLARDARYLIRLRRRDYVIRWPGAAA